MAAQWTVWCSRQKRWGAAASVALHASLLAALLVSVVPRPPVRPVLVISLAPQPMAESPAPAAPKPAEKAPVPAPPPRTETHDPVVKTVVPLRPRIEAKREKKIAAIAAPLATPNPAAEESVAPATGAAAPDGAAPAPESSMSGGNGAAATGSGGNAGGGSDRIHAYLAELHRLIQEELLYPPAARRIGLQGRVLVHFSIADDGRVLPDSLSVVTGSGVDLLDDGAIKTIQRIERFPPPPFGQIAIDVPVVFQVAR